MAAPRYDTLSAARHSHQAVTGAGHPPKSNRPARDSGLRAQTILPHGYTLAEVERLARKAAAATKGAWLDAADVYETCWFTIVEKLYTATEAPEPGRLYYDAIEALHNLNRAERRHAGMPQNPPVGEVRVYCSTPNFVRYWQWHTKPAPSPEPQTVERTALRQIWPRLREVDREAFSALAAAGNNADAAALLGLRQATFTQRLRMARRRFLRLWHEGETPSKQWRMDWYMTPAVLAHNRRPHDVGTCRCAPCTKLRAKRARLAAAGETVPA